LWWRGPEFVDLISREKVFHFRSPALRTEVRAKRFHPIPFDVEEPALIVETRPEPGERLMAHEHEKPDLGPVLGAGGIESRGAILDGEEAIARPVVASAHIGAHHPLG
jgi:hypothetical protein